MKRFLLMAIMLFSLAGVASAAKFQFTDNGHWYEAVSAPNIDWTSARDIAAGATYMESTGYLATITSQAENDFIFNTLRIGANAYWLGGYQNDGAAEPDGDWQWVTGEAWTYDNWANHEPNDLGSQGEDALAFAFFTADGRWNDAPTNYTRYGGRGGYVIEFEPVPEPATVLLFGMGAVGLFAGRGLKRRRDDTDGVEI